MSVLYDETMLGESTILVVTLPLLIRSGYQNTLRGPSFAKSDRRLRTRNCGLYLAAVAAIVGAIVAAMVAEAATVSGEGAWLLATAVLSPHLVGSDEPTLST